MKKLIPFAALLAMAIQPAPAVAAQFGFGGDVSTRLRVQTYDIDHQFADEVMWQYRVTLNGSVRFGDGFYARVQLANTEPNKLDSDKGIFGAPGTVAVGGGGGWQAVGYGNASFSSLGFNNAYLGRNYGDSHYAVGRLPLNSFDNPIYDLTFFPRNPIELPVATFLNDSMFGANYGTKVGAGELNLTLGVVDNIVGKEARHIKDGLLKDGYLLMASYRAEVAGVSVEPIVLAAITRMDSFTQETFKAAGPTSGTGENLNNKYRMPFHQGVRPVTFGANLSGPVGGVKIGAGAWYSIVKGTTPDRAVYNNSDVVVGGNPYGLDNRNAIVDYTAYFTRIKAEYGPVLVWWDHSVTTDRSKRADQPVAIKQTYTNNLAWAQYQYHAYEDKDVKLTLQPTLRFMVTKDEVDPTYNHSRLRYELWAVAAF
ncbi:MAG: hypothetical protein HGB02_01475 [Chlorobiaceae bacterium]|nr:hypothetical protein [Chlorobiaceae bacterium]